MWVSPGHFSGQAWDRGVYVGGLSVTSGHGVVLGGSLWEYEGKCRNPGWSGRACVVYPGSWGRIFSR